MGNAAPSAGGQTPPADPSPGQMPPTDRQTPNQPPSSSDDDQPMSVAEARKLREENKQRRLALEAAQAKIAEFESANQSAAEKAQREAAKHQQTALEYQQKYQELAVRTAIKDKASGMSFYDPEDAFRFLLASGELEYDDEGLPKNAEKLLKSLAESKPYLIKQQQSPPQSGLIPANPSRSSQSALPPFDPKNPPRLTDPATWNKR